MARVKPQNLQPIRTAEEANDALRELGELKRITADIENRMKRPSVPRRSPTRRS